MATIKSFQDDPLSQYLRKTALAESGGNSSAKNPNSTAVGKYQFLAGTWQDMVKKYNLGYTLADREDPNKSEKVMRLFTQENENILKPVVGRELNDGDRYLAHFLGAYGARDLYKVDPNTPVNKILSEGVLNANRSVMFNKDGSPKTAQDIRNWANSKMGASSEQEVDWDSQKVDIPQPKTGELSYLADTSLFSNFTPETQELQEVNQQKDNEKQLILDLINKAKVEYVEPETYMRDGGKIPISKDGVFASGGKPVIVPSSQITMQEVPYPILGIDNIGTKKMMYPNQTYKFPGDYVFEIPQK